MTGIPPISAISRVGSVAHQKHNPRRRQIDPTTCERDYSTDEVEFMNALAEYKRVSGRSFPTCSEILEVLRDLGYRKVVDLSSVIRSLDVEETEVAESEEAESERCCGEQFGCHQVDPPRVSFTPEVD